jgi:hypothetical protein
MKSIEDSGIETTTVVFPILKVDESIIFIFHFPRTVLPVIFNQKFAYVNEKEQENFFDENEGYPLPLFF